MNRFHIIIPAAGAGSRMASALPKQYLPLRGRPMIFHSIDTFSASPRIAGIHLALNHGDAFWHRMHSERYTRVTVHDTGGETRAETVLNTLAAIKPLVTQDDWILVHDAARPGLTLQLLDTLLDAVENDAVGGLLAVPLADTLKRANVDSRAESTIPRDRLWQAQTPQMFRYGLLYRALSSFDGIPTDEAQAVEALGLTPKLVTGSLRNMKMTYPQDLILMEAMMQKDFES